MNWSLASTANPQKPELVAAGDRARVKTVIATAPDLPPHARAFLTAELDALPATVSAVKVDAHYHTVGRKRILNYSLTELF